jgi:hypothetical protein
VSARNAQTRQDAQGRAIYTNGPFAGHAKNEVQGMTPKARQQLVDAYNRKHPAGGKGADPATQAAKDFYAKYGVKPVATAGINKAKNTVQNAATWLRRVQQSNPGMSLGQIGQLLTTGQPASKGGQAVPKMDALFVRVAMDLQQYGGVTASTANRLHRAGYSVKTLGFKPAPKAPASAGSLVPGVGPTVPR